MSSKVNIGASLVALLLVLASSFALAEQQRDNSTLGGVQVKVRLNHRVIIPQILYFRIGSATPGQVDVVKFNVAPSSGHLGNTHTYNGTGIPIGDGRELQATDNGELTVDIRANVGSLTLSYDVSNPLGLSNGVGNYLPFDEIKVITSSNGIEAPELSNSGSGAANAVTVNGNLYGGRVVLRRAKWKYTYLNNTAPAAGTYKGRVRYTLSSP